MLWMICYWVTCTWQLRHMLCYPGWPCRHFLGRISNTVSNLTEQLILWIAILQRLFNFWWGHGIDNLSVSQQSSFHWLFDTQKKNSILWILDGFHFGKWKWPIDGAFLRQSSYLKQELFGIWSPRGRGLEEKLWTMLSLYHTPLSGGSITHQKDLFRSFNTGTATCSRVQLP